MSAVPPVAFGVPLPPSPRRRERWWLHWLLFGLTLVTTTWIGASFAVNFRPALLRGGIQTLRDWRLLIDGALSYSLPLLSILLAHEMGHYLVCRKYGINASPPYFIPFPSLVGTMGAFIRIREPFRNKRELFDVGVAGPIAGFVVTLPLLAWGIAHSRPNLDPVLGEGTIIFRYPILVEWFQKLTLGRTFTSVEAVEHPVFVAAWFGLFVTALNLLPLGQLDGGHALYAIFGRWQKTIAIPLLVILALLGIRWPGWYVWIVFTFVTGLRHPPVRDEEVSLDPKRQAVAVLVLVIFLLCFAPIPLEIL
jgi:membrane-associated protease RseP (regulator of RpoE activity)